MLDPTGIQMASWGIMLAVSLFFTLFSVESELIVRVSDWDRIEIS